MQMTFEQAMRPGMLQAFATRRGSGYMMRSEKRGDAYRNGSNRPPKRKRAGFPYIFLTLLISIILWPVGMVMLWRRKVRLQAGTKLLISLLTLCLSVFLIVFALTVPVDSPEFTAFQDKANDWLDQAAADMAVAGDAALKKSSETWNVMSDFAEAGANLALEQAADGIDKGVELAGQARDAIEDLFHREPAPEPTEVPTEAPAETPEDTEAPAEVPEESEAPAETPEDTETPTEAPEDTEIPAETPEDTEIPTEAPEDTEIPAEVPEDTEIPTEAPEESEVPAETPEESEAPSEAPENTEAPQAAEAAADGGIDLRLPAVAPAPESALPLEAGLLHADGSLTPAAELAEETAAPEDSGEIWVAVEDVTEAPTAEATPVPDETAPAEEVSPEETPSGEAPAEAMSSPAYTVKPAGEATVYFYDNGSKGFHRTPTSHGMGGAPQHTLAEAYAMGKTRCNSCDMPEESLLTEAHVAWVDDAKRIHTTDECASFAGDWHLVSLAEAVDAGYEACPDCGATEYVEDIYPAPTPTPEPMAVSPAMPLKSIDDIAVYFYDSGRGYHIAPDCVGMSGAPVHTLAEAAAAGKRACGNCNPPDIALLGLPTLWLDENKLCHTSDDCASFAGSYSLIARDDALAQGLAACPDCGATEYLVPDTVLAQ